VIDWAEEMTLGTSGDVRGQVTLRAAVLREVRFLRLVHDLGGRQPAKRRGRTHVEVRNLRVVGAPGSTLRMTTTWLKDGRLALVVRFPQPPEVDSEIAVALEYHQGDLFRRRAPGGPALSVYRLDYGLGAFRFLPARRPA